MGRRGLIERRLGDVHPQNQTPALAVLCVGVATSACMFLGDAILVPITEVGSVASALSWTAACAAYYRMCTPGAQRLVAAVGATVGLGMVLMKVLPFVPGHFNGYEWLTFAIWIFLGLSLGLRTSLNKMSS